VSNLTALLQYLFSYPYSYPKSIPGEHIDYSVVKGSNSSKADNGILAAGLLANFKS
jgi:hypothetical protein